MRVRVRVRVRVRACLDGQLDAPQPGRGLVKLRSGLAEHAEAEGQRVRRQSAAELEQGRQLLCTLRGRKAIRVSIVRVVI